jgi:hypothetical protein
MDYAVHTQVCHPSPAGSKSFSLLTVKNFAHVSFFNSVQPKYFGHMPNEWHLGSAVHRSAAIFTASSFGNGAHNASESR